MDSDALTPSPYDIWKEIEQVPETREVRSQMYLERMRAVGHIVDREEGDDSPLLPCRDQSEGQR